MGGSSRRYRAADRKYTDRGPIIWWAKRLKPGDEVARWSFYGMRYETVTIKLNHPESKSVDVERLGGHDFESYYRLRPKWWPGFEFWTSVVLGVLILVGSLYLWLAAHEKSARECEKLCYPRDYTNRNGCWCAPETQK